MRNIQLDVQETRLSNESDSLSAAVGSDWFVLAAGAWAQLP